VKAPDDAHDSMLPVFSRSKLATLVAYVDAMYAADLKTRKSVTGLSVCYVGGCIAHKSKLQVTVATSSTEAEFISAVSTAKIVKYLCYVLQELELTETELTLLYIDNHAAMHMINDNKATPHSHHIDIQHVAIQEWRDELRSYTFQALSIPVMLRRRPLLLSFINATFDN
jgi:hypothetical protein